MILSALLSLALLGQSPPAQRTLDTGAVRARLEAGGRIALAGVVLERFDFDRQSGHVEAVVVRPLSAGRRAGIVVVPGHGRSAYDSLPQAIRFARAGFATVVVAQPGYGGSTGPADFAGPRTIAVLTAAAERFAGQPYVDPARLGTFGYSRGALAAAILATRTDLFRASVLGGGIYDFCAAHRQLQLPGIRANMEAEAGLTNEAVRLRSPILDVAGLDGPVLIIHGEADENAPPEQARALAARLQAAGRPYQLAMVPNGTHALSMNDVVAPAIRFFTRILRASD